MSPTRIRPVPRARRAAVSLTAAGLLLGVAACSDDAGGDARDGPDTTDGPEQDGGAAETAGELDARLDEPRPPSPPGEEVEPLSPPPADPELADLAAELVPVGQFDEPTDLEPRPDTDALYLAERDGRVLRLAPDGELPARTPGSEPVIDIRSEVVTEEEQGLSGLAFSPDGERIYLGYSLAPDGDTRIVSYEVDGDGQADDASRREVLAHQQPYGTHNNGDLDFGPDGYLYAGFGDGGHLGDPHGFGQDPSVLLGTIIRIDPEGAVADGGDEPYLVPEDNPFVDGEDGARPEVWLYGVRNPWRIHFDSATGDLWFGDVGQATWEEINWLPADDEEHPGGRGANLGWSEMEGSHPFEGDGENYEGGSGLNPVGARLPVYDYSNHREGGDGGCANMGGVVYRGEAIPDLEGAFVFGDWCNPSVRALTVEDGSVVAHTLLENLTVEAFATVVADSTGELYIASQDGPLYALVPTGE